MLLAAVDVPGHLQLVELRGSRGLGNLLCPVWPSSIGGRLASHAEGKECVCMYVCVCVCVGVLLVSVLSLH